jgi:hypothetical protein
MKFSAEMSELKKVEDSGIEESKTRRRRNGLAAMPPPILPPPALLYIQFTFEQPVVAANALRYHFSILHLSFPASVGCIALNYYEGTRIIHSLGGSK